MNLTKGIKELIVDRFLSGEPIHKIASWYGQKPEKIEVVLRLAMQHMFGRLNEKAHHEGGTGAG